MAKSNLFKLLVAALFILSTGVAVAGGHGQQRVCDQAGLIGSAYGACNVYCEALDCDGPLNPRRERACERALDRFIDLTGDVPPCVPRCPCASGWGHPDFVPADLTDSVCSIYLSDRGELIELQFSGGFGENGVEPTNTANLFIDDDEEWGFHGVGCTSEREDQSLLPSEDSGTFDMYNTFRNEDSQYDRQQNDIFGSCKAYLLRIIEENGVECAVVDDRTD